MHLAKVPNGSERALQEHNARTLDNHTNTNINSTRTGLNYNLTDGDAMERFRARLEQCSYRKQKNNVRLEEIVLTAPKNVTGQDMGRFFKIAYRALQGLTGGSANTVSAWVHMDETTPHMHFNFVPAVMVDGTLKLSAKTLMNRDKLKVLHTVVQRAINTEFGHSNYKVVADNQAERQQRSDTLQAYKSKMAEIDKLDRELDTAEQSLAELEQDITDASMERDSVQHEIDATRRHLADVNQELQENQGRLDEYNFYAYVAGTVETEYPDYYTEIQQDWQRELQEQHERAEQYYSDMEL